MLDKAIKLQYNKYVKRREKRSKKSQKNLKKTLDKLQKTCYNKHVRKTRTVLKTRKGKRMTKNAMMTLVNYFAFQNGLPSDVADAVDELKVELNRGAEKAQKNRELYAMAHDVVMNGLANMNVPVTVSELFEEIRADLPDGFSRGKVQYALLHYWQDEVVKIDGSPNTYKKA